MFVLALSTCKINGLAYVGHGRKLVDAALGAFHLVLVVYKVAEGSFERSDFWRWGE
jgi:hypothetical protein